MALIFLLLLAGACASQPENITKTFENAGYPVEDTTDGYLDGWMQQELTVYTEEDYGGLVFSQFNSSEEALEKFIQWLQYERLDPVQYQKYMVKDKKNFQKYARTADDRYYAFIRKGDMFVWVNLPVEMEENISQLLRKLGY